MINDILTDAKDRMEKSYENMCHDFSTMRVGRANPAILDCITVDYYGAPTPLNQTSNINAPEPRLLTKELKKPKWLSATFAEMPMIKSRLVKKITLPPKMK